MSVRLGATALAAAMVVAWAPLSTDAQVPNRRGDREQLEQRVRAQMGRVMRERLGLSEEQATRLSAVVEDFDGQRRELFQLEQATRRRVEALLLEGGDDQDEARELIGRMGELREQEAELFRAEQEALLDVLTPVQVLRLQELRQDLGRRIRALGGRNGQPGTGRGSGLPRGGRTGPGLAPGRGAPSGGAPGR